MPGPSRVSKLYLQSCGNHSLCADLPEHMERIHSTAVLPEQQYQVANDTFGVQLLRDVFQGLEPGLRGYPAHIPAGNTCLSVRAEVHSLGHDNRSSKRVRAKQSGGTGDGSTRQIPGCHVERHLSQSGDYDMI